MINFLEPSEARMIICTYQQSGKQAPCFALLLYTKNSNMSLVLSSNLSVILRSLIVANSHFLRFINRFLTFYGYSSKYYRTLEW